MQLLGQLKTWRMKWEYRRKNLSQDWKLLLKHSIQQWKVEQDLAKHLVLRWKLPMMRRIQVLTWNLLLPPLHPFSPQREGGACSSPL